MLIRFIFAPFHIVGLQLWMCGRDICESYYYSFVLIYSLIITFLVFSSVIYFTAAFRACLESFLVFFCLT